MLLPAAQNMIYAPIFNRIVMTTTYIKLEVCLGIIPVTTTYTIHGFWKSVAVLLRSNHVNTRETPSIRLRMASLLTIRSWYFFITEVATPRSSNTQYVLVRSMEQFRRHPQKILKIWLKIQ